MLQVQSLLIDVETVAALLGISVRSVWRRLSERKIPNPIQIGGKTLWRRKDIELFVEAGSMATFRRKKSGD